MAVMVVRTMLTITDHLFLVSCVIFDVFIEFVTSVDNLFGKDCAAFLPCHCPDETRPVFFRQSLQAAEASPQADVPDVTVCVVFRWRRPSADDVTDAVGFVLSGVGAEDAESGSDAPFHCGETAKSPLSAPPLGEYLTLPSLTRNASDVQRIVVPFTYCFHSFQVF
jgi:hypothetical protein